MWAHEIAARLEVAFEQMATVNKETFEDEVNKIRLAEALNIVRELIAEARAAKPNPGLYTGFMLDAAREAEVEMRDGVAWASIQVPDVTARQFLKEMGR